MTPTEFWKLCTDKYPEWGNPEHVVKLKARGLQRLLEQAAEVAAIQPKRAETSMPDCFKDLFGKFQK